MIRLAMLFLIALAVFVLLRFMLAKKPVSVRQFGLLYAATLAGLVLLYLGLTGRLHWLFSVLGVALPFLCRAVPIVLHFLNLKQAFDWVRRMSTIGSGGARARPGQQSELNTRFFAMTLDHDSGRMDGRVLEGRHEGHMLSDLALADLLSLLQEVAVDPDSENVLRAYLERVHPEWADQADAGEAPGRQDGNLSVNDAYDILGLEPGAGRDEVRAAHRRLIKSIHPDHGGSNWLAARINEAREVLLQHLDAGDDR